MFTENRINIGSDGNVSYRSVLTVFMQTIIVILKLSMGHVSEKKNYLLFPSEISCKLL